MAATSFQLGLAAARFSSLQYRSRHFMVRRIQRSFTTTTTTSTITSPPSAKVPKAMPLWLFGTAGAVGVMVTVGGITRLTRSGLSMTEWRLQGSLPPRTEAEWQAEFDRYKTFPEWHQRRSMTLDDFKFIFWWEYGHRMLGRALGVIYGVPLAYFAIRRQIPAYLRTKLLGLFLLGGGQGLVGWWMVKSGLTVDKTQKKEIRVSPYRLAAHLGVAFTTFTLLVHIGFEALRGVEVGGGSSSNNTKLMTLAREAMTSTQLQRAKRLRHFGMAAMALAFTTALSGAFVAGMDAGRAYNYFPKMTEDRWLPEEILEMKPIWVNFFENSATVQADHRLLATLTIATVTGMFIFARRGAGGQTLWMVLPRQTQKAINHTLAIAWAQGTLGVATLLTHVPIPLATLHQAGALALLGSSVWTMHTLKFAAGRMAVASAASSSAGISAATAATATSSSASAAASAVVGSAAARTAAGIGSKIA